MSRRPKNPPASYHEVSVKRSHREELTLPLMNDRTRNKPVKILVRNGVAMSNLGKELLESSRRAATSERPGTGSPSLSRGRDNPATLPQELPSERIESPVAKAGSAAESPASNLD